jgi:hypothetical protein
MKSLFSSLKYVFGNVYHVLCFPRPRWDVEVFFGISLYERLVNCHELSLNTLFLVMVFVNSIKNEI